jgi:hypothetical protein
MVKKATNFQKIRQYLLFISRIKHKFSFTLFYLETNVYSKNHYINHIIEFWY